MLIYTSFSILEQILSFMVSALKIVYIHLPCTVDRGGASILSRVNMGTKEKVRAKQ